MSDLNMPAGFSAEPVPRGSWRITRGNVYVGVVFPQVVPRPDGKWYAWLLGSDALLCDDQAAAVAHIVNHAPAIPLDSRRLA